MKSVDDDDDDC